MKYEVAELIIVGRAQDVILGIKNWPEIDNRCDPDVFFRDSMLGEFDE